VAFKKIFSNDLFNPKEPKREPHEPRHLGWFYALNPGDLNWEGLERLASCTIYDRTSPEKVVERVGDAELVLTNKTILVRPILEKLPRLRYIGVLATRVNVIDIDFARERGVTVTNVAGYGPASVAQMVFALLLEMTQPVGHHSELVRRSAWATRAARERLMAIVTDNLAAFMAGQPQNRVV
jgi:lactate dehydrogenase-like 2-hydroxyacid dehydrogenase